jgi:hypothetical protein
MPDNSLISFNAGCTIGKRRAHIPNIASITSAVCYFVYNNEYYLCMKTGHEEYHRNTRGGTEVSVGCSLGPYHEITQTNDSCQYYC